MGDYAFLYGHWNDYAVYQFKTKPVNDLDGGYRWSMADMVNGSSVGYEVSDAMSVASSNVAQLDAVAGGLNEVTLTLDLQDAGDSDITATISRESEIIITTWQPTYVEGTAEAHVEGNIVDLKLTGENRGWGAHALTVTAIAWTGREADVLTRDLGPLPPLGRADLEERWVLPEARAPHRVDVELEWGSGRRFFIVYDESNPPAPSVPLLGYGFFRSTLGLMIAVAILWVALPVLFRTWRGRKA